jgi:protease I
MISTDGFEDTELLVPLYRLQEENIEVDIAAPEAGTIKGKHGYEVQANLAVDAVKTTDYDMLVLPGGKAPATLRHDEQVLQVARDFFGKKKPVAAICHGPQILVTAGLLNGRTATAYKTVGKEIEQSGAHYKDEELVVDDNLITSRQPGDLPAFNRAITRRLAA